MQSLHWTIVSLLDFFYLLLFIYTNVGFVVSFVYRLNLVILNEFSLREEIVLMRIINKFILRKVNTWVHCSFYVFIPAKKSELFIGGWISMFINFYFVEGLKGISDLIVSCLVINYHIISAFITFLWELIVKAAIALYLLLYILKLYFFHQILVFIAHKLQIIHWIFALKLWLIKLILLYIRNLFAKRF